MEEITKPQEIARAFDCQVALTLVQGTQGRKRQWRDKYGTEWSKVHDQLKQD
jgi:hypothetical protein